MPVQVIAVPRKIVRVVSKSPAVRVTPRVATAAGRAVLVPSNVGSATYPSDPVASLVRVFQALDYLTLGGIFMGISMVLIGFSRASESKRTQKLEIASDVAPALIGAATGNPIVGQAAGVAIKEAQGKATAKDYSRVATRYAKTKRRKKKEG